MAAPAYTIVYAEAVKGHLVAIDKKHRGVIRSGIETQLSFAPVTETRNRKPLVRPVEFGAEWELRIGPGNRFRVFYRVREEERLVDILAIGVKDRNRLTIGGQEFEE